MQMYKHREITFQLYVQIEKNLIDIIKMLIT